MGEDVLLLMVVEVDLEELEVDNEMYQKEKDEEEGVHVVDLHCVDTMEIKGTVEMVIVVVSSMERGRNTKPCTAHSKKMDLCAHVKFR